MLALVVITVLTILAGAAVALITGSPLQFTQFNPVLVNFLSSLVIGVGAGLATADDVGRRELIGSAAAAQYAIFPVWFGIAMVIGFPDWGTSLARIVSFFINAATVLGAAVVTYTLIRIHGEDVLRFATTSRGRREERRRAA